VVAKTLGLVVEVLCLADHFGEVTLAVAAQEVGKSAQRQHILVVVGQEQRMHLTKVVEHNTIVERATQMSLFLRSYATLQTSMMLPLT